VLNEWKESSEEQVFKNFRYNRQEIDWPVGGKGMAWFPRL
jgi:hypothetical protein